MFAELSFTCGSNSQEENTVHDIWIHLAVVVASPLSLAAGFPQTKICGFCGEGLSNLPK